jgi:hypothetical protein
MIPNNKKNTLSKEELKLQKFAYYSDDCSHRSIEKIHPGKEVQICNYKQVSYCNMQTCTKKTENQEHPYLYGHQNRSRKSLHKETEKLLQNGPKGGI